jgi:hypothetical protein
MDRQKAIDELKIAQGNGDTEAAHSSADEVLCRLLSALGYQDVVDEWEKVDKWYA